MAKTNGKLYNLSAGRSNSQRKQMEDLEDRGICIFCRPHLETESKSLIELETTHWLARNNDYPYKDTKHHLVIVPKKHVGTISELPLVAQSEFLAVIASLEKRYRLTSYAVVLRSGDMRYNGGSVEHLHAHIVVGDTDNPEHQPVRFKISSRPS